MPRSRQGGGLKVITERIEREKTCERELRLDAKLKVESRSGVSRLAPVAESATSSCVFYFLFAP